jgi:8-oxo-dGTP pyrophosphatase MutT (NUDIX family)
VSPTSWIQEVRLRLGSPPPSRLAAGDTRHAAVLVPLYVEAGELWTLLTRRAETLPHHRGQIAFPGGGRETGEDVWGAALRESEEEIGLEPQRVLRLGELDEVATPSGFRIVPCVGAIPQPFEARPSPDEIDEVFALPVSVLANPSLVEDRDVKIDGERRTLRLYHVGRHVVWGVTARILQNLLARLGLGDQRWDPGAEP